MRQPELVVIDNIEDLSNLDPYLDHFEYWAYDSETTGVNKGAKVIGFSLCAEEEKAIYVILAAWNAKEQRLDTWSTPDYQKCARGLVERLMTKKLIMHNGIFDCARAEENFKLRLIDSLHTDTMILAHLLDENRRVGLKELGSALFGQDVMNEQQEMKASIQANGGMITKTQYDLYKADAHLIGKYGAKDAWMTYMLFMTLVPELYEQDLDKFFYEDESMPLLKGPTYDLNTVGLTVDNNALITLKKTLQAECAAAKDFIYQEIQPHIKTKYPGTTKKNTFNIGASQQLSWLLFGVLNLEFGTLTAGGKTVAKSLNMKTYSVGEKRNFIWTCQQQAGMVVQPEALVNGKKVKAKKLKEPWAYIKCDKSTLTKLAPKYKWIERLLEYQSKMKLLTTYVKGVESRVQYGVLYASYLQHGTTSGRYASRNPNLQNLPRNDKRIKACFVARPGKVFVGADQSQLEPRVFAYYSGDKRLLAAFQGEDDFYSVIGMETFDLYDCTPRKEGSPDAFGIKYKKYRDLAKVLALASTYGATAYQLAPTTGKSIDDTNEIISSYFEKFPSVKQFMLDSHEIVKETGRVTNLFGRPRRMPDAKKIVKIYGDMAHGEYPYEVRNILNLAINHRIQSTGASIVNRAAIAFKEHCKTAGIEATLVSQVHDSLVAECNEADADNISILLQNALENTVQLDGIRFEAKPNIGKTLAEV